MTFYSTDGKYSDMMLQTLPISAQERESGTLTSRHLQAAIAVIESDGFVALENVVDVGHADAINRQMAADLESFNATAAEPVRGGNFTPSRRPELLFRDILMNPIVASVAAAIMGSEISCGMYSSNITLPGLGDQELHVDMKPHAAKDDLSGPPHAMVVNFPLIDFTEQNGATELWPGTHRLSREPGENNVSRRLQDEWRAQRPPIRATLARGGALIRDMRLWHRGVINNSVTLRPMLALIINGGYRPGVDPLDSIACSGAFPAAARQFFETDPVIHYNPRYVTSEILPGPGHLPRTAG